MKLIPSNNYRVAIAAAFLGFSILNLNAQAPAAGRAAAAPAAGAPARGAAPAAPAAPALNAAQQAALSGVTVPPELATNATTAVTNLTTAALTLPTDPAKLRSLSDALATAELNLAMGRLAALAKANESLTKITGAQAAGVLGGGRGGRGSGNPGAAAAGPAAAAAFKDSQGFTSIFDGKTLTGWDGETNVWSVSPAPDAVGGSPSIHSDNSPGHTTGQHHIHFIGIPGVSPIVKDFEFKVEFHVEGGNAGIQYRSRLLSGHGPNRTIADPATIADPLGLPLPAGVTTAAAATAAGITGGNPWQVSGYQFDITGNGTGNLYEGQGRSTVGNVGEMIILHPGTPNHDIVAQLSDNAYASYGKPDGWNEAWIVARGGTLIHILNGRVFMVAVDDDPARRALSGIISLQLEQVGQVWYRNVRLKHLSN